MVTLTIYAFWFVLAVIEIVSFFTTPSTNSFTFTWILGVSKFLALKHLWGLVMYGRVSFFRYPILILFGIVCPLMVKTFRLYRIDILLTAMILVVEFLFWFHLLPFYPALRIWWQILMNWEFYVVKLLQVDSPGAWLSSGDFYIAVLFPLQ